MSDQLRIHIKAGAETGDWRGLQEFLKGAGAHWNVSEALVKQRFYAGCCIACGRDPCDHCEMQSAMWCEVCWGLIVKNCPDGMVVSGLARVMQQITYNQACEAAQAREKTE